MKELAAAHASKRTMDWWLNQFEAHRYMVQVFDWKNSRLDHLDFCRSDFSLRPLPREQEIPPVTLKTSFFGNYDPHRDLSS